jgi:hypothetical protein
MARKLDRTFVGIYDLALKESTREVMLCLDRAFDHKVLGQLAASSAQRLWKSITFEARRHYSESSHQHIKENCDAFLRNLPLHKHHGFRNVG